MLSFRSKEENMRNLKRTIMVLLIAIMAISGTMIARKNLRLKQEARDFAAIQAAMSETETVPETQPEPAKEEKEDGAEPTEPAYEPSETLKTLMEQYPDCIGYITIEGTKVAYPIMQNEDNEYYLHRDMEGKKSVGGCIYMDSNHDIHEKGLHVIYGHHMKNGSRCSAFYRRDLLRGTSEHHDPGFRSGSPFKTCILLCRQGRRHLSERPGKPRPGH